jgi:hypothetical protein
MLLPNKSSVVTTTTTSDAPIASYAHAIEPEFTQLPRTGERCRISGLSRSALNLLILPSKANNYRPPVASKSLRQPGHVRGIRLIVVRSLLGYLHSIPDAAQEARGAEAA